ncbi:MAG: DUF933 domain-containing protein [Deltaproteobacteria bacterium]|nr:DUF933 domain-containing protein [Deltaproteobacteria bacterium]
MKVGLTGFSRAGKTTLYNALTGLSTEVGGFETRHEAAMAVVKVPDPRVDALSEIVHPKDKKYAEVTFLDFPPSQERKAALETQSLAQLREVDALAQVVRAFDDPLASEPPAPVRDLNAFQAELILADLTVIEKRLERIRKEANKDHQREMELLTRCQSVLEEERPLRGLEFLPEERTLLSGFAFLSAKPLLVVYNTGEEALQEPLPADVAEYTAAENLTVVPVCGKLEMEIAQLDPDERAEFLSELGLSETARDRFIRHAYDHLHLMSFFTAGPVEVRAWTITRDTAAVNAAGKIHSDIERGFIRAEVISYGDYIEHRGESGCRSAGKLRLEGKEYRVQDGDVMHIRFNV